MSWAFGTPTPPYCSQMEGRALLTKYHDRIGHMKSSVSNSGWVDRLGYGVRCYQWSNGAYRVIFQKNIDGERDMDWTPIG